MLIWILLSFGDLKSQNSTKWFKSDLWKDHLFLKRSPPELPGNTLLGTNISQKHPHLFSWLDSPGACSVEVRWIGGGEIDSMGENGFLGSFIFGTKHLTVKTSQNSNTIDFQAGQLLLLTAPSFRAPKLPRPNWIPNSKSFLGGIAAWGPVTWFLASLIVLGDPGGLGCFKQNNSISWSPEQDFYITLPGAQICFGI